MATKKAEKISKLAIWKSYEAVRSALVNDPVELKYRVFYYREMLLKCDSVRARQVLQIKITQFCKMLRAFEIAAQASERGKAA